MKFVRGAVLSGSRLRRTSSDWCAFLSPQPTAGPHRLKNEKKNSAAPPQPEQDQHQSQKFFEHPRLITTIIPDYLASVGNPPAAGVAGRSCEGATSG